MLFFDAGVGLILLGLWVFCILDVIVTDESLCRNLPKVLWLIVVLLFPVVGSIVWLVAGRPATSVRSVGLPYKGNTGHFPEYDRPGRFAATNPDDDAEFLRQCRERAEEQRRIAREERRKETEE